MVNLSKEKETLAGYLIDIACLRTIPSSQLKKEAKDHSTTCALMGHCQESGYGLVGPDGKTVLLDPKATPLVVKVLNKTSTGKGVWLRVERDQENGKMETVAVSEAAAPE